MEYVAGEALAAHGATAAGLPANRIALVTRGRPHFGACLAALCAAALSSAGCASQPVSPAADKRAAAPHSTAATGTPGSTHEKPSYAVVIDASSSGSTLQIFQWRLGKDGGLPRIVSAPEPRGASEVTWQMRAKPGLSAYTGRAQEAAGSLEPLVDYALEKLGR